MNYSGTNWLHHVVLPNGMKANLYINTFRRPRQSNNNNNRYLNRPLNNSNKVIYINVLQQIHNHRKQNRETRPNEGRGAKNQGHLDEKDFIMKIIRKLKFANPTYKRPINSPSIRNQPNVIQYFRIKASETSEERRIRRAAEAAARRASEINRRRRLAEINRRRRSAEAIARRRGVINKGRGRKSVKEIRR
jgi:hypothetical protein